MKTSSAVISGIEPDVRIFPPDFDANTATVEEMDEWIIALGGRRLSPKQARAAIKNVLWGKVDGENPGEPGFPFASLIGKGQAQ